MILLRIAFGMVLIVSAKTFYTLGIKASPEDFISVIKSSLLVEYILWGILSVSFDSYITNKRWFQSTHNHSISERISLDEAGNKQISYTSSSGYNPDYSNSKKALIYSKIAMISSLIGAVIAAITT